MIFGIFIGLALYGFIDLIGDLLQMRLPKPDPTPTIVKKVMLPEGLTVWYEITATKHTHKIYPN